MTNPFATWFFLGLAASTSCKTSKPSQSEVREVSVQSDTQEHTEISYLHPYRYRLQEQTIERGGCPSWISPFDLKELCREPIREARFTDFQTHLQSYKTTMFRRSNFIKAPYPEPRELAALVEALGPGVDCLLKKYDKTQNCGFSYLSPVLISAMKTFFYSRSASSSIGSIPGERLVQIARSSQLNLGQVASQGALVLQARRKISSPAGLKADLGNFNEVFGEATTQRYLLANDVEIKEGTQIWITGREDFIDTVSGDFPVIFSNADFQQETGFLKCGAYATDIGATYCSMAEFVEAIVKDFELVGFVF